MDEKQRHSGNDGMTKDDGKKPDCFGDLDIVFPIDEDGLRSTPVECFDCPSKTDCLRTAMKREKGLRVREETIDRAYSSGMIGFFERWARKKDLRRKQEEMKRG